MREIYFRGKRLEKDEWVEGYFVAYKGHKEIYHIFEPDEVANGLDLGGYLEGSKMAEVILETIVSTQALSIKTARRFLKEIYLLSATGWYVCFGTNIAAVGIARILNQLTVKKHHTKKEIRTGGDLPPKLSATSTITPSCGTVI